MSKKLKIEIKIYTYHDMDLVSLFKTKQIQFPETTRKVLNSYAKGEVYRVQPIRRKNKTFLPKDAYKKYYHYYVVFDSEEDAPAINLLERITPGFRNNFVKTILRQYLCAVISSAYVIDGDTKYFNKMSNIIQGERDSIEIKGSWKKRKTKEIKQIPDISTQKDDKEETGTTRQTDITQNGSFNEENKHKTEDNTSLKNDKTAVKNETNSNENSLVDFDSKQAQESQYATQDEFIDISNDDSAFDDFLNGATEQY